MVYRTKNVATIRAVIRVSVWACDADTSQLLLVVDNTVEVHVRGLTTFSHIEQSHFCEKKNARANAATHTKCMRKNLI